MKWFQVREEHALYQGGIRDVALAFGFSSLTNMFESIRNRPETSEEAKSDPEKFFLLVQSILTSAYEEFPVNQVEFSSFEQVWNEKFPSDKRVLQTKVTLRRGELSPTDVAVLKSEIQLFFVLHQEPVK